MMVRPDGGRFAPRSDGGTGQVTGKAGNRARAVLAVFLSVILSFALPLNAADLQPQAAQNYERYIALTQAQVDTELAEGARYLWVERLPEARRAEALTELGHGGVVIARLETFDNGNPIPAPGGIIHHWIGTAFVPGATLAQTLAFMEDYDNKVEYFKPDIVRSKILKHEGDDYFVLLRFYQKKIITTVIDTDQEIHYQVIDKTHAWSRSHATRVQEVESAGTPDERLEPEGHDRGFVWKLNTFWRFEEKDGGTYLECQAISLSRDIPTGLGWMVRSFVSRVPKESLTFTLTTARTALGKKNSAANQSSAWPPGSKPSGS
jgi:hypothetical protein